MSEGEGDRDRDCLQGFDVSDRVRERGGERIGRVSIKESIPFYAMDAMYVSCAPQAVKKVRKI